MRTQCCCSDLLASEEEFSDACLLCASCRASSARPPGAPSPLLHTTLMPPCPHMLLCGYPHLCSMQACVKAACMSAALTGSRKPSLPPAQERHCVPDAVPAAAGHERRRRLSAHGALPGRQVASCLAGIFAPSTCQNDSFRRMGAPAATGIPCHTPLQLTLLASSMSSALSGGSQLLPAPKVVKTWTKQEH